MPRRVLKVNGKYWADVELHSHTYFMVLEDGDVFAAGFTEQEVIDGFKEEKKYKSAVVTIEDA